MTQENKTAILEMPKKYHDFLVNLANEMSTQDNRCTKSPYIFQIRYSIDFATDESYAEDYYYYDAEGAEDEFSDDKEVIEHLYYIDEIDKSKYDEWLKILQMKKQYDNNDFPEEKKDEYHMAYHHDFELDFQEYGIVKVHTREVEKYEQCFFSEKAAKEYLERFNIGKNQVVYATSLFSNDEMKTLQEIIMNFSTVDKPNNE